MSTWKSEFLGSGPGSVDHSVKLKAHVHPFFSVRKAKMMALGPFCTEL